MNRLRISKYWSFLTYYPIGSHTSTILQKITMVINFVQSRVESRVLIDFSCTVSEFQNTDHSQCMVS
ncbi:hypothetical protein B296_00054917 [Ensete ventricosum]|uniref:Uncharacterized protein n=1 Tax=Ensete ventricosum TaxID=4639 RepID=A0A426WWZ6_ENSVE|nr:hypothetical protein B296_00054917 [Ensete ventricosum]